MIMVIVIIGFVNDWLLNNDWSDMVDLDWSVMNNRGVVDWGYMGDMVDWSNIFSDVVSWLSNLVFRTFTVDFSDESMSNI
jgi:hypothetical protein